MSFNNDEDGDGLAALFGGITPQAAPKSADEAQPAVAPVPVTPQPAAQQPPAQQPAAPQPVAQQPAYQAPASYDLPAPTEAPPASAYPSAQPQYPGLSPDPTADPDYARLAAHYPGLAAQGRAAAEEQSPQAVAPPPQYPPTQYPPTDYPPATQYPPTEYPATQYPPTTQYPGLAPQVTPSEPPSYDLPAPVDQPPTPYPAPAQPSGFPEPLTEPPGSPRYEPSLPDYSATPAADFAQPVSYDLPAPAAAPSAPASPGFDPAPTFDPQPTYDPTPAYGATPPYDATGDYRATTAFESQQPAAFDPSPASPPGHEPFRENASPSPYAAAEQPGAALAPTPVTPAGPLLPSSTAAVVTPEDLERATVGEKVGLALAILTGPIGLLIAIISAVRGGRRRGWLIGISRVSLVLGVLSTIAAVIVGIVGWNIRADQIQHDGLAAASSEFCEAAAADPSMVTPPTLGFPVQGNSIPETIDAITAWTTRWSDLAATSPAKLRTGLELLAEKGQTIVDSVTQSRSVDDALNAQVIGSIQAQSGVPAWYETYCVTP